MTFVLTWMGLAFANEDAWERCYPKGYSEEAWCQIFEVPISSDSTDTLSLSVVKLPAIRPNPKADPLIFIAGGPGQSAIDNIAFASQAMRTIQRERDVLFIDQRGTGQSSPIECQTPQINPDQWSSDSTLNDYNDAMVRCLQQSPIPLSYFGSKYAVQDIEFVRKTLKLDQINLYGVSYGTRVAQVYMRRFPEHSRAVILDGVVPMDEPIGQEFKKHAQGVLNQLEKECRQDEACTELTDSLTGDLEMVLKNLKQEPNILAPNPSTGTMTTYQLSPEIVMSGIRLALYSPLLQRMLPYTISEAKKGHFTPLLAQTIQPSQRLEEGLSSGLYYAIYCTEDYPRLQPDIDKVSTVMDVLTSKQADDICGQIQQPAIDARFFEPITSDIPVLMTSGARDPITPPALAEKAGKELSNAQYIVAPQAAHNVGLEMCAAKLLGQFIANPNEVASSSCIENADAKPWVTNTSGASP
ncbi:MAG: alpha/beta fold hydrolase [Myxococcota bacterium]